MAKYSVLFGLVCSILMAMANAAAADDGLIADQMLEPMTSPAGSGTAQTQSPPPAAPQQDASLTFVGRRGKVHAVERNGTVHDVRKSHITFRNQADGTAYPAWTPPLALPDAGEEPGENPEPESPEEAPGGGDEPQTGKSNGKGAEDIEKDEGDWLRELQQRGAWLFGKDKQPLSSEEVEKRIKQKDFSGITASDIYMTGATDSVSADPAKRNESLLRQLQQQGAWFYDKDNRPLTAGEVEKRIESGETAGIRATDIYLRTWTTEGEEKTD